MDTDKFPRRPLPDELLVTVARGVVDRGQHRADRGDYAGPRRVALEQCGAEDLESFPVGRKHVIDDDVVGFCAQLQDRGKKIG